MSAACWWAPMGGAELSWVRGSPGWSGMLWKRSFALLCWTTCYTWHHNGLNSWWNYIVSSRRSFINPLLPTTRCCVRQGPEETTHLWLWFTAKSGFYGSFWRNRGYNMSYWLDYSLFGKGVYRWLVMSEWVVYKFFAFLAHLPEVPVRSHLTQSDPKLDSSLGDIPTRSAQYEHRDAVVGWLQLSAQTFWHSNCNLFTTQS